MRGLLIVYLVQAGFSGYNLYLSSISVRNLQKYEEKSERAAEWSRTAADQLHRTRTTQAAAVGAVLSSFLSAIGLMFYSTGFLGKLVVGGVNVGILFAAAEHVGAFWRGKAKIPLPGVGEYNEAIGKTNEIRGNMWTLFASWIVVGLLGLVMS